MSATNKHQTGVQRPIVFELVEATNETAGRINDFALKPISGAEAFRKYNWLLNTPGLNKSGKFRGMVVSARMRTVYMFSESAGNYLTLVSILLEAAREMERIQKIYRSNIDISEKGPRLLLLGSAAILRAVTSVVPTGFHLMAMSIQGYAHLYTLITGSQSGERASDWLSRADKNVSAIHRRQWDGENWYNVIEATLR